MDHPDIQKLDSLLKHPDISAENREYLHFALGKIYADCGCYDDAFAHYELANQIRNSGLNYDPEQAR